MCMVHVGCVCHVWGTCGLCVAGVFIVEGRFFFFECIIFIHMHTHVYAFLPFLSFPSLFFFCSCFYLMPSRWQVKERNGDEWCALVENKIKCAKGRANVCVFALQFFL